MTGHQDQAYVRAMQFDRGQTRWFDRGLCKGDKEDIWFPLPPNHGWSHDEPKQKKPRKHREPGRRQIYAEQVAFAISICDECPVKAECLADAESRNEQYGIWGGKDFHKTRTEREAERVA